MYIYEEVKWDIARKLTYCKKYNELSIYPNNENCELMSAFETLSQVGLMSSRGLDADGDSWYSVTQSQLDHLLELFNK